MSSSALDDGDTACRSHWLQISIAATTA